MSSAASGDYREDLIGDLRWLGLEWDEGPDVGGPSAPYSPVASAAACTRELFARLEAEGRAYPCYCTPEELELSRKLQRMAGKPPRYAGTCRGLTPAAARRARRPAACRPTLRFAVPGRQWPSISTTAVHGPQHFPSADIGDFIIRREDGTPAFFFCNAVDDALMGVTQVLRGDDHLTNTPRQLMLLDALRTAPRRLRPRRAAGGRRRRAAVQAARQHQRARVSRARLPGRGAAQSPVPSRSRQRRRAAGSPPAGHAGAFSARPSGPRRRRASTKRSSMHWQKETLQRMSRGRDRRDGSARTDRGVRRSWCGTTWCCPPTRRPGSPCCTANCRPWGRMRSA